MGASENWGTLFWGPYSKDPAIPGTILGSSIFRNPQIRVSHYRSPSCASELLWDGTTPAAAETATAAPVKQLPPLALL